MEVGGAEIRVGGGWLTLHVLFTVKQPVYALVESLKKNIATRNICMQCQTGGVEVGR